PEVLSFCMFGSMVKGMAHEGSDIDGYLYIDSAQVAKGEGISEEQVLENSVTLNQTYLTQEVAKKYILEFRAGVRERTGLEDKDVEHIRSRPISEKVIDMEIARLLAFYKAREEYDAKVKGWADSRPPRGSSVDDLVAYEKARPIYPSYVAPSLGDMFHLDVGGGVKKYRKIFIERLNELGPSGEKIWEDTIRSAEMIENNLSTAPNKRYPRTLVAARAVYAS
ncbi:MAG: hypothetical protein WC250_03510, partial [Candidatus Paceibacterota bacterium]